MPVEWHREAENAYAKMPDGTKVELSKLLCPECLTVHRETTVHQPADPRLEWSATCPVGHTWRFYL